MLQSLARFFVRIVERWLPDPFVIAVLLTTFVFAMAVFVADYSVAASLQSWGDGIWGLLAFTMQIVLTFVLGYALATTSPAQRFLGALTGRVHTARGAYLMVTVVAGISSFMSWGFGLVAGAIIARIMGENCTRRGIKVHYPLLVACAYSAYVLWHQGFSGSITLAINTPGHFLEDSIGLVGVGETIFTTWNLSVAALILLSLPFLMASLAPSAAETRPLQLGPEEHVSVDSAVEANTPASRIENAPYLNWLVAAAGIGFLFNFFVENPGGLNLNIINFTFLIAGIALSKSPKHYVQLMSDAARVVGPFLLQYPFYAGLMGLMRDSGLGGMVVALFTQVATAETLPLYSFFSAGLLNIFVPSGGGQWALQGPIVVDAALQLGADIPRVAMAVAMGDQWTNLIQPLFAIPLLAIAGLHIRDIMGYCVIALIFTGAIFVSALTFF